MIYANILMVFFAFLFLGIASYSDLKSRIISNKLVLFFFTFGLTFNILLSLVTKNYISLLMLLLSAIIAFIVFVVFWELGVIAGGDVKLFIAISVLMPTMQNTLHLFNIGQNNFVNFPVFSLFLFFCSVFMTLPWIFLYSKYLLFKRKQLFKLIKEILSKSNLTLMLDSVLVVTLVGLILGIMNLQNPWLIVLLSFLLTFTIFKIKLKKIFYYVLFFGYTIVICFIIFNNFTTNLNIINNFLITCLFVFLISVFLIYYRYIKENVFVESKTINKLKEGDIPVYSYYYTKRKLIVKKETFFKKIISLANNTYYKDLKIDSSKACGISRKDIAFLKDMYKNKLIDNKIYLKKTIAFTPAVLLAYILLVLF